MTLESVTMLVVIAGAAVISPFVVDRIQPWLKVPAVVELGGLARARIGNPVPASD